jgi:valyl-tRNA synthetase
MLHPFMPFLTEELWHQLPQKNGAKSIALAGYPEPGEEPLRLEHLMQFTLMQEVITALRNIRSEMKLDPKKRVAAELFVWDGLTREAIKRNQDGIIRLGMLSQLTISETPILQTGGVQRSTSQFDVRIAYAEAADAAVERARLKKELEGLQKAVASKERQLGDETFRSRAPEKIIRNLEETLAAQKIEVEKLKGRLAHLA